MKKLSFRTVILALVVVLSIPCLVQPVVARPPVPVFPLPPPIVFAEPPEMIVLPETEVYAVPNVEQDIFFHNGWWWRPWEGRWYRSREYGSGWGFYRGVPSWYGGIPLGWRDNYRNHIWGGHPWNYRGIPHHEFRQNWRGWQRDGHWRNQRNWGTEGRYHQGGTRGGTIHQGGTRGGPIHQGGTVHQGGTKGGTVHQGTGTGTKQFTKGQTTGQQHRGTGTTVEKHDKR
jgi:hypothetical protein